MKQMIRCKVCGYLMEPGEEHEVCPACGVDKKVFEPYTVKLSEKRFKLLSRHIHPILLHFPQAFVLLAVVLIVTAMVSTGGWKVYIVGVLKFTLVLLPFATLAGFLSGIYDAKLRFKKLSPPVLRFKIMLGLVFLALSILDAVLVMVMAPTLVTLIILFVITAAASACAAVLGTAGSKLFDAFMPG